VKPAPTGHRTKAGVGRVGQPHGQMSNQEGGNILGRSRHGVGLGQDGIGKTGRQLALELKAADARPDDRLAEMSQDGATGNEHEETGPWIPGPEAGEIVNEGRFERPEAGRSNDLWVCLARGHPCDSLFSFPSWPRSWSGFFSVFGEPAPPDGGASAPKGDQFPMICKLSKPGHSASFRNALALSLTITLLVGCSKSNNSAAKGSEKVGKLPAGVAARVDGTEIPTKDLDQMMLVMMQQGFQPDSTTPGATPDEQRRNFALDRLIERQVVLNAALAAGVGPTPAELDQRIAQVKTTYGIGDSLPDGMTEATLRKNLSDDMTITQYFNKTVIDSIPVSQADVQAYYDQNPAMFAGDNRIHTSHILFLVPQGAPSEQKAVIQKKAEVVLAQAKKGEDFAELARKYSEDPQSGPGGGDMQWFNRGQMVPEFEAAAFAMDAGQISNLVETSYGFHIIKVIEKGKPLSIEEVKPDLERVLRSQKAQLAVKARIDQLKAGTDVVKAQTAG